MKLKLSFAVSALAGVFVAASAQAAVVYDTITVYDASGAVIGGVAATPAQVAANPNAIFYVPGLFADPAQDGNYGIVLAGSVAVDIFGIAAGGPDPLDLAFGPGQQASGYPVQNPVPDTGLPINMTAYLLPALQAAGDTAYFTATGNIVINTPEPAAWSLMILGFGLVGAARRRASKPRAAVAL